MIRGRLPARVGAIERAGGVVVAQLHRPGEVIIELDAIDTAALHDLLNQPDEAGPHLGVGGIEPDPQILQRRGLQRGPVHRIEGTAIAAPQQPVGVLLHHGAVGRLHQPVLEPGNHLQATTLGAARQAADRVETGIGCRQGGLQRRMAAAVEGGTSAPDIGVEGVEPGQGQLLHRLLDAGRVVVEGAGAVGEPHPHTRAAGLGQDRGGDRWAGRC